jgi:hypothetical protein
MFDDIYVPDADDVEELRSILDDVAMAAYEGYLDLANSSQDPNSAEVFLALAEFVKNSKQEFIDMSISLATNDLKIKS